VVIDRAAIAVDAPFSGEQRSGIVGDGTRLA
jgi:hypothetical protein